MTDQDGGRAAVEKSQHAYTRGPKCIERKGEWIGGSGQEGSENGQLGWSGQEGREYRQLGGAGKEGRTVWAIRPAGELLGYQDGRW